MKPTIKTKKAVEKPISGIKSGLIIGVSLGTAKIEIKSIKINRLYKKRYFILRKMIVSNPQNQYQVGDFVMIAPCRPISKRKKYRIIGKIEKQGSKK